ncbi:hypothetical protein D3C75_772360 [compost metagenome]
MIFITVMPTRNISTSRKIYAEVVLKENISGIAIPRNRRPSADKPRMSDLMGLPFWRRTVNRRDIASTPAASIALMVPYWLEESERVFTTTKGSTTFSDTTKKLTQNTMLITARITGFLKT